MDTYQIHTEFARVIRSAAQFRVELNSNRVLAAWKSYSVSVVRLPSLLCAVTNSTISPINWDVQSQLTDREHLPWECAAGASQRTKVTNLLRFQ